MILYFSGTENSHYIAKELATATKDTLTEITKKELDKKWEYTLEDGERLGFVFPIYWWGMPTLVEEFIQKIPLHLKGNNYIYGVSTYGLVALNGLHDLRKLLSKKRLDLHAVFEVKMVDNYVVGYELKDKETQEQICRQAQITLKQIASDVKNKKHIRIRDTFATTVKPIVHRMYKCTNHQKGFHVTDSCIGCGYCMNHCPCQVIAMKNNKPIWQGNCSFCLKCIHSCPVEAVQYKMGTEGRSRYLHHSTIS